MAMQSSDLSWEDMDHYLNIFWSEEVIETSREVVQEYKDIEYLIFELWRADGFDFSIIEWADVPNFEVAIEAVLTKAPDDKLFNEMLCEQLKKYYKKAIQVLLYKASFDLTRNRCSTDALDYFEE